MRRKLNLFAAALIGIAILAAPASASVFLEDLTWTELRDVISAGATTVIIPIGGTEQNGPAIALGKHNTRVKILAQKIAEKLGHTIVAPVVSYVPEGTIDPPMAHMKFPGTITIPDSTFNQLLESAAKSLKHAGFKNVILIGDHGSYQKNETAVAAKLNKDWAGGNARAYAAIEYYALAQGAYVDALIAKGHPKSEIGTHAGLADTSLQLAVAPSMVRQDMLNSGPKLTAAEGVYNGDPKRSSAALGQMGIDLIVNGTVSAIQSFIAKP
jgi:creatinine amidohydrolase